MGATVFEISWGVLIKGVGTKRLCKGRVKKGPDEKGHLAGSWQQYSCQYDKQGHVFKADQHKWIKFMPELKKYSLCKMSNKMN